MKTYRHYGTDVFDPTRLYSIDKSLMGYKPVGLWASPVECGLSWKDWCEGEDFHTDRLERHFDFMLADDARILEIHKPADILPYTVDNPYSCFCRKLGDPTLDKLIDIPKLMQHFDAMEVYFSENYNAMHWSHMFYPYDVDSIVVWNLDKVAVVNDK